MPKSFSLRAIPTLLPGVLLAGLVAFLGIQASEIIGVNLLGFSRTPISGIMMAIIIGILVSNTVALPASFKPGIQFSLKFVLRLGIILLGIRLSLSDVFRLGSLALPVIIVCISGALIFTRWLGERLHLSPRMSTLVAVGTSICGATAIVATGPAIDAKEEEVAYAVANITVFGVLAMLLYPYLAHLLFSTDHTAAGLFLGTSIHETAQVAGSGLIYSQIFNAPQALDTATVTKLIRNVFIAVVVPLMTIYYHRQNLSDEERKHQSFFSLFPLFIIGFVVMAALRTIGDLTLSNGLAFGLLNEADWSSFTRNIQSLSEALLAMAMAAVGLSTGLRQLRALGLRPFYVGFGTAVCVGVLSLVVIEALRLIGAY
ncbi:MAG: putative sulfate exporter family transporter [Anaerolineae bacterium]|nr:putative sulfate exporter family transporter [Anaerolineae bacterium]